MAVVRLRERWVGCSCGASRCDWRLGIPWDGVRLSVWPMLRDLEHGRNVSFPALIRQTRWLVHVDFQDIILEHFHPAMTAKNMVGSFSSKTGLAAHANEGRRPFAPST